MKYKELETKSGQELSNMLKDKRSRLVALTFKLKAGQLKHSDQIGKEKKDIARILTKLKNNNNIL